MEYKCPSCGAAMEFDSKTQKMKCSYCLTTMEIDAFQKLQQEEDPGSEEGISWSAGGTGQWKEGETAGMRIYVCQSCGGEIVAEETTGATACPFCGNRVVMKEQFSGDLRPDYIIPFKLDKKAAKAAYQKHLQGKAFLPAIFKKENHIDEIKGVYVPFWLFEADAQANIHYRGEKLRSWMQGDLEYTECEFYEIQRSGSIHFQNIPVDGSKKMDDALMESIEPYQFSEAVPFETAYLSGYLADRYDVEMEKCFVRANNRIRRSTESSFERTVEGYASLRKEKSNVRVTNARYWYALYPVWILNTKWRGKKYVFAMNGQTGKMVGDLPFDKKEYNKYVITRGILIGAVIYALMWALVLI